MHILNLDTAATETNLDSLRADADALTPTSLPQLPAAALEKRKPSLPTRFGR